jgi:hypothetical protein
MAWAAERGALASYLEEHAVTLVCLNGDAKGTRYKIDRERVALGSGPGATLVFSARGIEREHAVIEFWGACFVLREVDPARPPSLNGVPCRCRELRDGDRFDLGELTFEFHCEKRGQNGISLRW